MSTTTEHEVALFEENGVKFIMVWIDHEDVNTFAETYTEKQWQDEIEAHPFITERNLPVVIAFETEDGTPRLYGPSQYVDSIANDYDWDSLEWGYSLTLDWETEED